MATFPRNELEIDLVEALNKLLAERMSQRQLMPLLPLIPLLPLRSGAPARAPGVRPVAHLTCDKASHFSQPKAQFVTLPCPKDHISLILDHQSLSAWPCGPDHRP
jgi:hypothetical protein